MTRHWDIRVDRKIVGDFWWARQPLADLESMGKEAYLAEAAGAPPRIRHEIYKYGSDINPVQWLNWIEQHWRDSRGRGTGR